MSLAILADDLTGAADCAARCRQAGWPAAIYLCPPHLPLAPGAVAFTSNSRDLPAGEAARRVRAAITPLLAATDVVWYKKIDSTLRGNLGSELSAMLDLLTPAGRIPCAVISPAFPAQQRGLEHGYLVPDLMATHSLYLPDLLAQQTARPLAAIGLDAVRAGTGALAQQMSAAVAQGAQLLVVDALTDSDLCTLLAAAHRALPHALLCGSAGLVGVWATEAGLSSEAAYGAGLPSRPAYKDQVAAGEDRLPPDQAPELPGPLLAVVGSGSDQAHRQIEAVRRQGVAHTLEIRPDAPVPIVHGSGHWVLHLPRPVPGTRLAGPLAQAMVAHLARVAVAAADRLQPSRLVLVGGDTAIHVLENLGIERLEVLQEVLPGMPVARAADRNGQDWFVVLKAGNHGADDALVTLLDLSAG